MQGEGALSALSDGHEAGDVGRDVPSSADATRSCGFKHASDVLPAKLSAALAPVTVVVGHYGVGKTNFAINLVLDLAQGEREVALGAAGGRQVVAPDSACDTSVTVPDAAPDTTYRPSASAPVTYPIALVDLDVVNPYFRSTEYRSLLEEAGVEVVSPVFAEAGTSLDVPSLTGAVVPAVERAHAGKGVCVIDAGGDDVGATALGRFARHIAAGSYAMLYVVNCFRNLTQQPEDALDILREVERASRLQATGIVSNAHLAEETDEGVIERGVRFASEVARLSGLPLVCATAPKSLTRHKRGKLPASSCGEVLYPVSLHVKTPWQA